MSPSSAIPPSASSPPTAFLTAYTLLPLTSRLKILTVTQDELITHNLRKPAIDLEFYRRLLKQLIVIEGLKENDR